MNYDYCISERWIRLAFINMVAAEENTNRNDLLNW